MNLRILPLASAMALSAAGVLAGPVSAAETTLRVEHAAARLVVIPEARNDVSYSVQAGRPGLPAIQMRREGDALILDGGLQTGLGHSRIQGCDSWGASHVVDDQTVWKLDLGKVVRIEGLGGVKVADLPVVTVHVPLDAKIRAGGAVFGEVGPTRSLDLGNGGCGEWSVADVTGLAHFALGGSGDVHAHNIGDGHADIGGSSNLYIAAANALEANVGGSGNVKVKTVSGPISVKIGGSGNTIVEGGAAPHVQASVAGSGNFIFRGTAGSVSAAMAGSGNVNIAHATGAVNKTIAGSGTVKIGR